MGKIYIKNPIIFGFNLKGVWLDVFGFNLKGVWLDVIRNAMDF